MNCKINSVENKIPEILYRTCFVLVDIVNDEQRNIGILIWDGKM